MQCIFITYIPCFTPFLFQDSLLTLQKFYSLGIFFSLYKLQGPIWISHILKGKGLELGTETWLTY